MKKSKCRRRHGVRSAGPYEDWHTGIFACCIKENATLAVKPYSQYFPKVFLAKFITEIIGGQINGTQCNMDKIMILINRFSNRLKSYRLESPSPVRQCGMRSTAIIVLAPQILRIAI